MVFHIQFGVHAQVGVVPGTFRSPDEGQLPRVKRPVVKETTPETVTIGVSAGVYSI